MPNMALRHRMSLHVEGRGRGDLAGQTPHVVGRKNRCLRPVGHVSSASTGSRLAKQEAGTFGLIVERQGAQVLRSSPFARPPHEGHAIGAAIRWHPQHYQLPTHLAGYIETVPEPRACLGWPARGLLTHRRWEWRPLPRAWALEWQLAGLPWVRGSLGRRLIKRG